MDLWWHLRGWSRLRLTSADCAAVLRCISGEMRLEDITFRDELTVEFSVLSGGERQLLDRYGGAMTMLRSGGAPAVGRGIWRWRRLCAVILLFGLLTVLLPTRIWFIRVEGNSAVPERKILEAAEEVGLSLGTPAVGIQSEQLKNKLLFTIPQLRWAGINTQGCTAVITVAERQMGEEKEQWEPGDLVATTDGIVTDMLVHRGTALVEPGYGVKAGQILVSGATDLGICTQVEQAHGEIWGLTRRVIRATLPGNTVKRRETGAVKRYYSLRIGKKSVNFSNDSGILHGTCVKMRTVDYLTLPGGFRLPAALVTETYFLCETEDAPRGESGWLMDSARRIIKEKLRGGTVLRENVVQEGELLTAIFECREQIGVFRPGTDLERDTLDRENSERGAG